MRARPGLAEPCLLATVVRGHSHDTHRVFRPGEPEGEITVGARGSWEVAGPGVVATHLRLRFDGRELFAASMNGSSLLGGRPLGPDWTPVRDGDELRFGFAMLRIGREAPPSESAPARPRNVRRLGLAVVGAAVVLGLVLVVAARLATPRSEETLASASVSASVQLSPPARDTATPPPIADPPVVPRDVPQLPSQKLSDAAAAALPISPVSPSDGARTNPAEDGSQEPHVAYPQNIANRPIPRVGQEPWLISDEWRAHHERLLHAANRGSAKVIFLGDSITEGWWSAPAYKEYFGKYAPLNLGIASDTTQNVLWRIEHGALDGTHPQAVILMAGINNLAGGFSAQDTAGGLRAIIAAVQGRLPETRILLIAVLPARQDPGNPLRQRIQDCNKLLAAFAQPGRVEVIDVGSVLLEPDGSISKATLRDYLHPTPLGYEKLSAAVAPKLAALTGA